MILEELCKIKSFGSNMESSVTPQDIADKEAELGFALPQVKQVSYYDNSRKISGYFETVGTARRPKLTEKFLVYMENQGWSAEMNEKQEFCLPEPMKSRYTGYPESWMRFVSIVKSMVRKDERAWFLCAEDYDMQGDKAWQWNEWELLSLDAAGDDAVWKEEIRQFWDGHLPFFLSLEGGYAYYAFSLEDGSVVRGAEPEFEECETVADSFEDFMEKVMSGRIRL